MIRLGIREKIQYSVILLLVLTMCLIGLYVYFSSYNTYTDLLRRIMAKDIERSATELANLFESIENKILLLANTPEVQHALDQPPPTTRSRDLDDYMILRRTVLLYEQTDDVISARLFLNNGRRFYHDFEKVFPDVTYLERQPADVLSEGFGLQWTSEYHTTDQAGATSSVVSCLCPIFSPSDFTRISGVVLFDIDGSLIRSLLAPLLSWNGALYHIYHSSGRRISSNSDTDLDIEASVPLLDAAGTEIMYGRSPSSMVFWARVGSSRFSLAVTIPLTEIRHTSIRLVRRLLLIGVIVLVVSVLCAYLIAGNITRRLRRLAESMNTIEQSNFNEEIPVSGDDEVTELTRTFNHMIERIRSLIVDVYIGRIRSAKARLSLLQAQINPHFLYNTLDTINWEAKRAKARTISYMIEQLSDFLRLSLNNGSEKTTVKQEIQHVQAYFNIQKKRMEDDVRLQIFVPGNLHRVECLNLILQPVVENAVVHGIMQKEDRTGSITISGNIEGNDVRLCVNDNGVGFPPNKIDDLNTLFEDVENADSADSFGLMNVHSRIRMAYGEPYGLSLCNQKSGGARVTLTLPASSNSLSKQT